MARISRGKELIVTTLSSVSKTAVVIAFVCLLALSGTVFAAGYTGSGIPLDGAEDGDVAEYTEGATGDISVESSNPLHGDYSIRVTSGGGPNPVWSPAGGGLDYYPQPGDTFKYQMRDVSGDGQTGIVYGVQDGSNWYKLLIGDSNSVEFIKANSTDGNYAIQTSKTYSGSWSTNDKVWVEVEWTEAGEHTITIFDSTGASQGTRTFNDGQHGAGGFGFDNAATSDETILFDGGASPPSTLSGSVTDSNNEDLENVSINVTDDSGTEVANTTTDHLGAYSLSLENGTYDVTASKQNYSTVNKTVTVSGEDQTVDFQLAQFDQSITLDSRMYMEYGQEAPYEVVVSVDGDRRGVTEEATVTSGNASVVTIDDTDQEVIATNDTSVNQRTYVQAVWNDSEGNTYTTRRNVTVANATVENIGILPDFTRFTASLSDETVMVIIIATGVGASAALFATSFAGVSAVTMVMLLGWLAGYVGNGMAILSVLMAMFVGMNVSSSVDYTVRR